MDIFGVCRSHIYRMLREGELDYADNRRPAKVTKQSVLAAIRKRTLDESDITIAIQTSVELLDACKRLSHAPQDTDNVAHTG